MEEKLLEMDKAADVPEKSEAADTALGGEETPAEEPAKKTANDRLKERYPDADPQTDDDWEGLRNRYMDDTENSEREMKEYEDDINELISSDKDLALILNDMMVNHLPFRAALARRIDLSTLTPQEGDDDYAAWDKAYKERVDENQRLVEKQKEIDENAERSFENIDKFCEEKGYDEATKDSIIDFINEVFDAIVMKDISPELLEQLDKARTFDTAVRDAALEGEVKGRNANIEAQRMDEMEQEEGDGVPVPAATGGSPLQPKEETSTFSASDFWSGVGKGDWTKK